MKKQAKTTTSSFASPRWVKATIIYRNVYHLRAGLGLVAKLQLENMTHLCYFARYTSPPFRLELQMFTSQPLAALRKVILSYRSQNVAPLQVSFEKCNGSPAHACACQTIMTMAGMNQLSLAALGAVCEAMHNMAGFSYTQYAANCNFQAANVLKQIPGWTEQPIFGKRTAAPTVVPNVPRTASRRTELEHRKAQALR